MIPVDSKQAPASFFPVTSYIKGQMLILDSMPVTPLLITTVKGKSDSAWLTKEKLKLFLQPFLNPVIGETNLMGFFKETRFNDQTLHAITFTYDPPGKLPDSMSIRHWDVYVDPDKGIVTKVYIVKQLKERDQQLTRQLTWQTDKYAKITTLRNKQDGGLELLKEELCVWDF